MRKSALSLATAILIGLSPGCGGGSGSEGGGDTGPERQGSDTTGAPAEAGSVCDRMPMDAVSSATGYPLDSMDEFTSRSCEYGVGGTGDNADRAAGHVSVNVRSRSSPDADPEPGLDADGLPTHGCAGCKPPGTVEEVPGFGDRAVIITESAPDGTIGVAQMHIFVGTEEIEIRVSGKKDPAAGYQEFVDDVKRVGELAIAASRARE